MPGLYSVLCCETPYIPRDWRNFMSVVACIQMASSPNIGANLLEAERLIEEAVSQHARLVV